MSRPPQSMKLPTWWWLLVFAKKEAKSGQSSGAVPKMRRQSFHSDAMPQIKHNSRWLGQDWGLLAIKIQFGQNVSTSADRLIPNQIRQCVGLQQKKQSLDGRQNCNSWGRLRQSLLQSSQLRKNCRIDLILARQRDNDRPLCVFAADQWNYIFKHDAKRAHQPSLFKQTIF